MIAELYCHECRSWGPVEEATTFQKGYVCSRCGDTILCDECGSAWTDDHDH